MSQGDDSVDAFVERLRQLINLQGVGFIQTDPVGLEAGLRRVQVELDRLIDLAHYNAQHVRSAQAACPVEARPVEPPAQHAGFINVEGMTDGCAPKLAHLNVQQVSGVREVVLLHEIARREGTATLMALRDAVSDLWKSNDPKNNDAALRQQLSRLASERHIESVTNGNYRITPIGEDQLLKAARLRIGLVQEARPDLVPCLRAMRGWDAQVASH